MYYYPFNVKDYKSSTGHLSNEEDLAYRRMLDLYYQLEGPLNDASSVARRVQSTPEIVAVILEEFFEKTNDGWRNARCDEVISRYQAKVNSARRANIRRWGSDTDPKPDLNSEFTSLVGFKSDLKSDATQIQTNNQEPMTNIDWVVNDRENPLGYELASIGLISDTNQIPTNNHKPITNISSLRSYGPTDLNSDLKSENAKRARQIPSDFQPTDQHRQLAQDLGLNLDREFAKFSDHHRARGTVFKDWDAALRTWLRKSLDFGTRPGPAQTPIDPVSIEQSKANHKVFVEIDSDDWEAWKATGRKMPASDCKLPDGQIKRGWWFPSARP